MVTAAATAATIGMAVPAQADPQLFEGLIVAATLSDDVAAPGDTLTLEVTVDNNTGTAYNEIELAMGIGPLNLEGCTTISGPAPDCTVVGTTLSVAWSPAPTGLSATASAELTVADGTAPGTYVVSVLENRNGNTFAGDGFSITVPASDADVAVSLAATAAPPLGGYIDYTATATNNGPGAVTDATITTQLPTATASVSNLSSGCGYNAAARQVTCTTGAIAATGDADRSFRAHLGLLSLGPLTATATRTASSPADPVPGNNSGSATCTVLTGLIVAC